MDITNPLKLIGGATEIAKTLLTAETVVEKAQLQLQMAEVMGALASARIALLDADSEVRGRDEEITRLHAARATRQDLVEGGGGYFWRTDGKGHKVGYPCCPTCLVREDRQVPMVRDGALNRGRCPHCNERYTPVGYWNAPKNEGDEPSADEESRLGITTFEQLGKDLA